MMQLEPMPPHSGSKSIAAVLALLAALAAPQAQAAAPASPAWDVQSIPAPTNFIPGEESGEDGYQVFIVNSGAKATDGSPITITDTLPKGIGVKGLELRAPRGANPDVTAGGCAAPVTVGEVTRVSCEVTNALLPGEEPARLEPGEGLLLSISVTVPPTASGTLVNEVEVEGGGAAKVSAEAENQASAANPEAGFQEFKAELTGPDGLPVGTADSHPYQYTTSFAVNTITTKPGAGIPLIAAGGNLREIEVALPPGLAGNPTATERCTAQQFVDSQCPAGSAIGLVMVQQLEGAPSRDVTPLYNLVPPRGMPAQFGFLVTGAPIYINTRVRSDGDYGVGAYLENVTEANRVTAIRVAVRGTPGGLGGSPPLRLPSSCANPLLTGMSFETWAQPPAAASTSSEAPAPTDCAAPPFTPTITAKPTTVVADSPSGLHVDLHLPQAQNEDPEGLAEADLKDATVTLPEGLNVNPSSADGLQGCSLAQIGYQGVEEGKPSFSAVPAQCPDAAKIGTVQIETPLLDHPLPGAVYLARQSENPFGSLLAIYIAVADPESGVVVKLAGRVEADAGSGRLTIEFDQMPQLPFEDFTFDLFSGPRALLKTPTNCGIFATGSALTPWTSPEGASASPLDTFATTVAPGGATRCPVAEAEAPHRPVFAAGTLSARAGAFSPFVLKIGREDGSQRLAAIDSTLPRGLIGKLAGIPYCRGAELGACPAASELGTVQIAAGAGPTPLYIGGSAFLAGPYKGAPLSMTLVVPAQAGPFDLGTVVVRVALHVDPSTAQVDAVSDPLPTILRGIPLDVRAVILTLDRPGFTLNPTSCEPTSITGAAVSPTGQSAALSARFQVGGCSRLGFRPKLSVRLAGSARRGAHPGLHAVIRSRRNDANAGRIAVTLPATELLDNRHIRAICSRPQFVAHNCPPSSIYGRARAWTPLLDRPLEGPIYLRASEGRLPDLAVTLDGQVQVDLVGRVGSEGGRLRIAFRELPDIPLSKFALTLQGGSKGLLINSGGICAHKQRTGVDLEAQNGRFRRANPVVRTSCEHG
jgi:hypothetical protein